MANLNNLINTGKGSFRQQIVNTLQSMAPYSSQDFIDLIEIDNPKYKDFYTKGTRRQELLNQHSVTQGNPYDLPHGQMGDSNQYYQFAYANIEPDKIKRLKEYRLIAAYDFVSDALDEICDEFIVHDEKHQIFQFNIENDKIDKQAKETLEAEFYKFVRYFDFDHKGWEYLRDILVDGELYFENVIVEGEEDKGILGVVSIPTESIDPIYDNVQNLMIKGYLLRKQIFDKESKQIKEIRPIVFDQNQVTYFNSGIWNEEKTFRVPELEKSRKAYKQLSLIEDSIVIHRTINGADKMVFNIDVANMPQPAAERYIRQMAQNYWSRKTYDSKQGGVNMFNPQSMLDAFWFPKRAGSDGTKVERLAGNQNLGDLPDLDFFVKKLYKSLHVPASRLSSDTGYSDGTEIVREELSFARFIIRLQQLFSVVIKDKFVTHLKLKGWWDEYVEQGLKLDNVKVKMNEPTHFNEMRKQQLFEIRSNNYATMSQSEFVSETIAQKKYLGWNDKEVLANREALRKDAEFQWELGQIQTLGPDWRNVEDQEAEAAAANFDAGPGGIAGGSALDGSGGIENVEGDDGDDNQPQAQPQGTPPQFGTPPEPQG